MSAKTSTDTSTESKVRHVRIPDPIWVEASKKATGEGMTISVLIRALLRGYLRGDFMV